MQGEPDDAVSLPETAVHIGAGWSEFERAIDSYFRAYWGPEGQVVPGGRFWGITGAVHPSHLASGSRSEEPDPRGQGN